MKIAYVVNQYPKVSHSFIRREILALERQGLTIDRYALRGWDDTTLVDPQDIEERDRTRFVLQGGFGALLWQTLKWSVGHPGIFWRGLQLAMALSRGGDRTLAHHLVALAEAAQLAQWLVASGAQHVHAHFGTNSAEVAMLAHALGGPPYSVTVHGPEEWDMPQQLKLRDKVHDAAFVVGISSFACAQLMRWSRAEDWPRIHQVHCGLGADFFDGPPCPSPANARFVCVGRLCAQKAQGLLIEAVARLVQRGVTIELVLAGDGEDRADLEERIAAHGLDATVRITGWLSGEQVRKELLAARALVLASAAEGLPVVIMEAMALRRPVIATNVAGIAELVREGKDGWLVAAGSVSALVDAIERCLGKSSAAMHEMGELGHARVAERHSADDQAKRLASLFRRYAGAST